VDIDHGAKFEAWSLPGWIFLTAAVLSVTLFLASMFGDDVCGSIC